jgi:hypothetical protein
MYKALCEGRQVLRCRGMEKSVYSSFLNFSVFVLTSLFPHRFLGAFAKFQNLYEDICTFMTLRSFLFECKIPSYEPDYITTFVTSPLCNMNSLPLCEGRYKNEKTKLRKSYRKSASLSLIGHGRVQTSNEECIGANKRTQKAA